MSSKSTSRKYESPLRRARTEQTAGLIVDAAAQEIASNGMVELSMQKIAERAGISVRTLYRHFATREELLLAIGEQLESELTGQHPAEIRTTREFIDAMPELFQFFEDNAEAVEALHATQVGRQIRGVSRARRTEAVREQAMGLLEGLPEDEARLAFAMVRSMFGSATWLALRRELALEPEEAKRAVHWMAEMFVREIKRRKRQLARNQGEG